MSPEFESSVLQQLGHIQGELVGIRLELERQNERLLRHETGDMHLAEGEIRTIIDKTTTANQASTENSLNRSLNIKTIAVGMGLVLTALLQLLGVKVPM